MDLEKAHAFVDAFWEDKILPALSECIGIPVFPRAFDPGWLPLQKMREIRHSSVRTG